MPKQMQQLLAEVVGTFVLVFVGAGAVMGFGGSADPFAFGIALLGGPLRLRRGVRWPLQPDRLAGALPRPPDEGARSRRLLDRAVRRGRAGVLGLLLMTSSDYVAKAATVPAQGGVRAAFFVEVFASAIFMIIILQVTRSAAAKSTAYVAIGLTLLATQFVSVPFSGGSQNPARSFATALIGGKWTDFWIYILAPLAGAILGWLVFTVVIKGDLNLKDDFEAIRKEAGGAMGSGGPASNA